MRLFVYFGEDQVQDPENLLNTMRHRGPDVWDLA